MDMDTLVKELKRLKAAYLNGELTQQELASSSVFALERWLGDVILN